jgi:hypothetical protein
VVGTNLLGALLCARQAAATMLRQEMGGHIFFVDGAGSDGMATPMYAGAWRAPLGRCQARAVAREGAREHDGRSCWGEALCVRGGGGEWQTVLPC